MAEAILDKALPKRVRREGPPRSAPGETPLPTKFYRAGGGSGGEDLMLQGFDVLCAKDYSISGRRCAPPAAESWLTNANCTSPAGAAALPMAWQLAN